jgi:hypothetical protein
MFPDLPESSRDRTAQLSHNLDTVLFTPGIHRTKDLFTNVHFLDPFVSQVPNPEEIDQSKLPEFVPPSGDKVRCPPLHTLISANTLWFPFATQVVSPAACPESRQDLCGLHLLDDRGPFSGLFYDFQVQETADTDVFQGVPKRGLHCVVLPPKTNTTPHLTFGSLTPLPSLPRRQPS